MDRDFFELIESIAAVVGVITFPLFLHQLFKNQTFKKREVKINKQIKNDDVLIRALLSYHNDKMYDEIAELLVLNPINSFDDKYQNDLIALVFSIANEHLKSCSTEKLQDLFQVLPEGISAKQIKLRQDDLLKITDEISRYGDIKKR